MAGTAGLRAMATKLHPDAGGSPEAMVRLNQLRDKLNRMRFNNGLTTSRSGSTQFRGRNIAAT